MSLTKILRENLKPAGSKNLVRLSMRPAAMFDHGFITKCINDVVMKNKMVELGLEEISSLERLGLNLLIDSTGYTMEEIKEMVKDEAKPTNSKIVTKEQTMAKL